MSLSIDDLIGHSPLPWEPEFDGEKNARDVEEFLRSEDIRKQAQAIRQHGADTLAKG